jgi:3-hydroxybutyryl-CoA dehydrogenase
MSRTEHIAVIGAGSMGYGIAQIFATNGNEVILYDSDPAVLEEAVHHIRSNLIFLLNNKLFLAESIEPAMACIRQGSSLKETVTGARFVIEAVDDELRVKQSLFQEMERYSSPIAVLATSTLGLRVTEIAAGIQAKERVVGTCFWPPVYLNPLVEVVGGLDTLPDVIDYTCNLLKTAGKYPVMIKRDVPGLVGNRLQYALLREAMALVEDGIADPETVDEVVKKGFGSLLPVLGPLENADMNGLDTTYRLHAYISKFIKNTSIPSSLLENKLDAGELGFKSNQGFYSWDAASMKKRREDLYLHLARWVREQRGLDCGQHRGDTR